MKLRCHVFSAVSLHSTHIASTRVPMRSFAMSIIQVVWCLKMFWNLSVIYYKVETEHREEIRWRFRYSLSVKRWQKRSVKVVKRWLQHWFHLIPDYTVCKYFAGKPVATNNFGLCFPAKEKFYRHFWRPHVSIWQLEKKFRSPVGAYSLKKVNFRPCSGMILLEHSQFFALHSNQWDCFILYRHQIMSNGFFRLDTNHDCVQVHCVACSSCHLWHMLWFLME